MDYNYELVSALGKEISEALRKNNEPMVNAINNLAMNTGNKTTREYNELKKKYIELENKYNKSNSMLKSIITLYTLFVYNHNLMCGPINSNKILEIIDQTNDYIQKRQNSFMPDALYEDIINTSNEVYEKLIRR